MGSDLSDGDLDLRREMATMFGVDVGGLGEKPKLVRTLDRWRSDAVIDRGGRSCLLDNTTLLQAGLGLGSANPNAGPALSAATILALETTIVGLVLYDSPRHLQNPRPAVDLLPSGMAAALEEIPCDLYSDVWLQEFPGLLEFLDYLISTAWAQYQAGSSSAAMVEEIEKLTKAWFPDKDVGILWDDWQSSWPSPVKESGPFAVYSDIETGYEFLSERSVTDAGVRGLFNIRIADGMRLPYLSNRLRAPAIRHHLSERSVLSMGFGTEAHQRLEDALSEYRSEAIRLAARGTEVDMPPLLAICLDSADGDLARVPAVVEQLRHQAKPLRTSLLKIEREWDGGNVFRADREIDQLVGQLQAEYQTWSETVRTAAPGLAVGAGAFVALSAVGLSPVVAGLLVPAFSPKGSSAVADRLAARLLEPQQWFLTRLGGLSEQASAVTADSIAKMWSCDKDLARSVLDRYQRVASA